MGNCLASLFGRPRRPRSYFTGRYKDYNVAVEFDNLIEDENDDGNEREVVSKSEKEHLINKQFSKLVEDQRRVDAEIDAELHQEEERTRLEEEAYIAANREAARIAKQAKRLEEQKRKKPTSNGSVKSWAGDNGDWSMANEDEEDFDSFLQTVTARSANVRASVASLSQTNQHPTQILSPEPIPVTTSEFSWDEDEGLRGSPGSIPSRTHSSRKQDPFQDSTPSDLFSSQKTDSEWEADFVSAEKELVTTVAKDGSGDAPSASSLNGTLKNEDATPLAKRPDTNSFSITDEEDDLILDIEPENSEDFDSAVQNDTDVFDQVDPKNASTIEARAFDIDIDKFLEELDAEL